MSNQSTDSISIACDKTNVIGPKCPGHRYLWPHKQYCAGQNANKRQKQAIWTHQP